MPIELTKSIAVQAVQKTWAMVAPNLTDQDAEEAARELREFFDGKVTSEPEQDDGR